MAAAESESSGDDQCQIPITKLSGQYTIEGFRDAFVVATTLQPETLTLPNGTYTFDHLLNTYPGQSVPAVVRQLLARENKFTKKHVFCDDSSHFFFPMTTNNLIPGQNRVDVIYEHIGFRSFNHLSTNRKSRSKKSTNGQNGFIVALDKIDE